MIQIGDQTYPLDDPLVIGIGLGAFATLLILVLLIMTLRRAGKSSQSVDYVAGQVGRLAQDIGVLNQGQHTLAGSIKTVSEQQAHGQSQVLQNMEQRLAEVRQQMTEQLHESQRRSSVAMAEMQERMKDTLSGSTEKTTKSLTELQERLATIDKAQTNIEKLSGDVLSLQDILSNKQRRGMFGEIQLTDIVSKALPVDSYALQATLSNGKRADCLIHLPNPPGPIVIDAKFPFEAYEQLAAAQSPDQQKTALRDLASAVRKHIKDISERYIIDGETADGAIMFLPSEAVYAELHARLPEVVREGFTARVWIVSPTTCMATLNTMRAILKDARMREQTGAIRKELALLGGDVERLVTRVGNLDRHFGQAAKDIEDIKISAEKAGKRAHRLDHFDFEELAPEGDTKVVPIGQPKV
ncbi:DNA recombination protein RmuC [Cognatiyoonia sp. IB215182]|uniref:DNA recombination protein RmuC n=1 Tax=Cognatiyoonia sp. IB215182 TaxID=3097353 RepID=UPI002A10A402|nr:DNA recombination protein RmuC [Cognatiyoonia sp. IB215182]MDX8354558.1 DNA recombination protein RmuC [Cognatiyoonia sp. IB215182]